MKLRASPFPGLRLASRRIALLAPLALAGTACGTSTPGSAFDAAVTSPAKDSGHTTTLPTHDGGGISLGGGDAGSGVGVPSGPVKDFPKPVLDGNAPANSAALFGAGVNGAATGGPCIVEPESNVLYPQDWLRPRFRWNAVGGQNLFELRLHVPNQIDDLVVYSTNTSWTMPLAMWNLLRTDSPTEPITLSIRGGVLSGGTLTGESLGSSTSMEIAPVQATGAIVYWTTSRE